MEPATGSKIQPKKKVTSNGNRLPDSICDGEMLIDNAENRWKLGRSLGVQGSGEVYLASSEADEPVGSDAQHIIKIEPHKNGSLFMEISCYLRMARSDVIDKWKKGRNVKHVGLSRYMGSGSHVYRGEKYRFLVLERYGQDLDKLFLQTERRFPGKAVFYIGIQILDTLEYIHSHGYIHGDIKGPNLLLGYRKGTENCVYLPDFGRASRYLDRNGVHNEYGCGQSIVHAGSFEYTSRDAHIGAFSRRGDLEMLGYNMLQWLCGKLPWEDTDNPEYIHFEKNGFISNIPMLMHQCFRDSEQPAVLSQYLQHVASLGFETTPDYAYCRKLLRQGIEDSGYVYDGKLVFGDSPLAGVIENNDRRNKRKATEDPENAVEVNPKKKISSTLWQPCASNRMTQNSPTSSVLPSHQQFSLKKIIPVNPEKQVEKHIALYHKLPNNIPANSEQVVSYCMMQKFTESLPEVSEPTKPWQQTADTSSFSNPTPAMLEIMPKMRQKALTPAAHQGGMCRARPPVQSSRKVQVTMPGCVDDGKLVFGDSPLAGVIENNDQGNKRKATEDPENIAELKPKKRICHTLQQPFASNGTTQNSPTSSVLPSHQQFSLEKIISVNPEKQVEKHAALNHKLPNNIPANSEQVVSYCMMQQFTESLPEVSEPTKPWQQTADTSSFSILTLAMLEITSKIRQKASTPAAHWGGMCRARPSVQHPREVHVTMPGDRWWWK